MERKGRFYIPLGIVRTPLSLQHKSALGRHTDLCMAAVPVTLPQLHGAVLHSIRCHSHEISTLVTLAASTQRGKAISTYPQQALPSRKLSKPSQITKTSGMSCKAWTQTCCPLGDTSCEEMTQMQKKKISANMFLTNGTGRYPTSEMKLFTSISLANTLVMKMKGFLEGRTSSPGKMLTCLQYWTDKQPSFWSVSIYHSTITQVQH